MTANTNTQSPSTRAEFNSAMAAILTEHATLRHLAAVASQPSDLSADSAMSLADALAAHESTEARLFALPFVTRPPKSVAATGAQAHRRGLDYAAGKFRGQDPSVAAALFVDALLAHLAVEEAWLAEEDEHQRERLSIIA